MTGAILILLGLCLLLSATLTAAQTAAFQVSESRMRTLKSEGFKGAEALTQVRRRAGNVGSSVRLITDTLNLGTMGIGVATGVLTLQRGPSALDVMVGVVIIIVFADALPRSIAARHPVRLALASASGLLNLTQWTRWISVPVSRLEDALVKNREDELSMEERELREIQEIGQEEGVLEESENLLVERAFRLDELTAWDAMVPRVDIFAWQEDLTLSEIIDGLPDVPYSRVPVYKDSVDDVTGILYVREAYERISQGMHDLKLHQISRTPFFVPGSLSLAQLMQDFQAKRIHMGIVADEFGGTDGLVTLEDVLEELVGEIRDETDVEEEEIHRVSRNQIECDAGVDVRDINQALGVTLPKLEHRSLNGLILEELGHVPSVGEKLLCDDVRIEIMQATETQVIRAQVTRLTDLQTSNNN
ncbi:MAG TPA: HlyC/CorC family transporter [Gemmatimonadetes bacterium]|jgi:putative hemolysin|nr:HlyC/CorC family transporter [Gemmatimonadota bacterium]